MPPPLHGMVDRLPGGIAIVRLVGTMVKYSRSRSGLCGTSEARGHIRQLCEDQGVAAILLLVDSPGGEVAGAADLAAEVASACHKMPVAAYIEDCGCSAAYWAASQCSAGVWCNSTARVGAVGAMLVVNDLSEGMQRAGIKTHLISSGKWKGLGVPGIPIDDDDVAHLQAQVSHVGSEFAQAVQRGRNLSDAQMAVVTRAGVFIGEQALEVGLVDGVLSLDEAIERLQSLTPPRASQPSRRKSAHRKPSEHYGRERSMDQETEQQISSEALAPDSLALACRDLGIFTQEALKERIMMAELGEKHLHTRRESARREAVRCFGAEAAPTISAQVDVLPAAAVEKLQTAWQREADERFGHAADGSAPRRASAPVPLPTAVLDAQHTGNPTAWQQLTDEQRSFAGRIGMDSDDRRESFARTVLGCGMRGGE